MEKISTKQFIALAKLAGDKAKSLEEFLLIACNDSESDDDKAFVAEQLAEIVFFQNLRDAMLRLSKGQQKQVENIFRLKNILVLLQKTFKEDENGQFLTLAEICEAINVTYINDVRDALFLLSYKMVKKTKYNQMGEIEGYKLKRINTEQ